MKAIVCEGYGSSELLKIKEVPTPTVKPNELLIKIGASTVASGDCVVKNAANPFVKIVFGLKRPRNPILGTDLAGVVEQVGKNVKNYKIGDRVIASTGMKFGCHAEYISLNEKKAITLIPENLSYEEAVTLAFGGTAALHFLKKVKIDKHTKILIYGASGAVGSSSIQIAKYFGAEVTGVCSAKNSEMVKSLGADHVLAYTSDAWKVDLEKYDYIFDAVGKTTKADWQNALKDDGNFATIAKGLVRASNADLFRLVELAENGQLKPVIDRVYPMSQIGQAYEYVESGRKKGNVVIEIS
ncbi:NADPH:quinone reductase [Enterococcus silesiacus]|uniref:NADPH:quinone reductase n=1 Tax=Enterococcus silesiacus TaxID=332949 RepID=A0A0S3K6Q6_9ENTE|nr:NAD(P)-dependent alcohol dehydrogenase [Enterococcus silesiacus]ALR99963.1 NADPH:quinone reductase [Enterococcus silesiacus]OJG92729.1 hypothetical protein RV15_GL002674 [Enterococcus silesiacus]